MEVINPIEYSGWDELLLTHPEQSVFHTAGWARVLIDSYGFTPQYLVEFDGDRIAAAFPVMEVRNFVSGKRGVSLPFFDYCDPLLGKSIPIQEALGKVIVHAKEKGWTSLEIRTRKNLPAEIFPLGFYLNHDLDISVGEDKLFSRFRASNQRNIKKASREGVEVQMQTSMEAAEKYYQLHCVTRKMHGLPPQPFSFFCNIQKHILSKGNGFVALASHRGEQIAGGIYLHYGKNAVFKFGASERRYQALRANNLIMWEAIRWYSQKGFRNFSFGRTDPENEGLRNFKRAWGSDETRIARVRYDMVNGKYDHTKKMTYGIHNKIFRHLPICVSTQIGKMIYKYMD